MGKRITDEEYEQILEAAHGGDAEALYKLARMYYHGGYVSRDRIKAFKYYDQAFAAGANISGEDFIYMADGHRQDGDIYAALELYRMAAEKGVGFGYECMGDIYFEQEKYEKSWEYFNKPEEKNNLALYRIGYMYEMGLAVDKDEKKARSYYETVIKDTEGDPACELDESYQAAVEAIKRLDGKD